MKIGFITSSLSSQDGIGRYSKSLTEAVSRFAEVSVLASKEIENETFLKRVFPVLPMPNFNFFTQAKVCYYAFKFLRTCDAVHVLTEPFCVGASWASWISGFALVITLHGTYSIPPSGRSPKAFIKRALMRFAYYRATITTTGSYNTEKKVRKIFPGFGECRFIPNGVDEKIFHEIAVEKPDQPFMMTVGEIKARKGADLCVSALNLLKDEFPTLRYKIIGTVNENAPYVLELRGLIKKFGLGGRVDFLGRISDNFLVKLYNQCGVFVLAARDDKGNFEGFPMVFFEANACGVPVITTKGFGSEYAIQDGVNGFLVNPDDPAQLADAIKKILSDGSLREQLRKDSFAAAKKHTWDNIAENFLMKMYQDALLK